MKLGILICDHLPETLKAEFGDYCLMFNRLLEQIKAPLQIEYFFAIDGQLPANIDVCDVYMSSGSKASVNDDLPWLHELEIFIRQLYVGKKGFVGICFGHQLIARTLGGKVEQSAKGWGVGVSTAEIKIKKNWMIPYKANLNIIVSHQDQVVKLPPQTEVLLGNEFCPYSMIQVGEHFLGMQGHPEFTPAYSLALMNIRKSIIPARTITQAKVSLTQDTDELIVVQWLIKFLQGTLDR